MTLETAALSTADWALISLARPRPAGDDPIALEVWVWLTRQAHVAVALGGAQLGLEARWPAPDDHAIAGTPPADRIARAREFLRQAEPLLLRLAPDELTDLSRQISGAEPGGGGGGLWTRRPAAPPAS